MRRRLLPLALLAGLAVGAAATDAAHPPTAPPPPAAQRRLREPSPTPQPAPADPAVAVARAYATAARSWTAATYRTAWERQLALAAPGYRRALRAARPTAAQIRALWTDD